MDLQMFAERLRDVDVMFRIAELVNSLDMNYSQIAKEIGCSRGALYNYANMVSDMNVVHLKRLCELTGVSADYILFGRK